MKIPLFKPRAGHEAVQAVRKVIYSGWLGKGERVTELEREFERMYGGHAVATNSCTAALSLAYEAFGVTAGALVTVPTWTFASTATAAIRLGGVVAFADINQDTLCLDLASSIAPRQSACLTWVGMAGSASGAEEALHYAGNRCKSLVMDCAHMPPVPLWWNEAGTRVALCFSFHAVKHLGAGDGGMVIFDEPEEAEWARRQSWLGIDRDTHSRSNGAYDWEYDQPQIGEKCHMNDITAAIVLSLLPGLRDDIRNRKRIAKRYCDELETVEAPPYVEEHNWHLYIVRSDDRDGLRAHLTDRGITTGVHYTPLDSRDVYKTWGTCPVAAREYPRVLSLPMYPQMTDAEQSYVIEAVNSYRGA